MKQMKHSPASYNPSICNSYCMNMIEVEQIMAHNLQFMSSTVSFPFILK